MDQFSENFTNAINKRASEREEYSYYEDTHDVNADYTSRLRSFRETDRYPRPDQPQQQQYATQNAQAQNFMVYKPKTADDVQTLIDHLKNRESAIINLDDVEPDTAQRVLDFASGAVYALSGTVHKVSGNIFLLSPQGVDVTNTIDRNKR